MTMFYCSYLAAFTLKIISNLIFYNWVQSRQDYYIVRTQLYKNYLMMYRVTKNQTNYTQASHNHNFNQNSSFQMDQRPQARIEQQITISSHNNPPTKIKQQRLVYGAQNIGHLVAFFVPFLLVAPMITYYMAVSSGEQHPFPHTTITDTACHYPQNIQFRCIMAGSGSFLSLIYWVLFRWITYEKQRTQYPGTIYSYIHYLCQFSVWGFMTAMGTIDGGGYPNLHTISAVFFFIMLFIIVMTQTIVLRDMYLWDSTVLSRKSIMIKSVLGIYVAVVWGFSLYGLLTKSSDQNEDSNIYIVILEWNSVYVCLMWILSYLPEWITLHVTLSEYKPTQTIQNINC